ncbi:MAG: hypothetical protein ACFFA6_10930 [Promethearchaeota archaeon]
MYAGKVLSIIAGILTLLATFLFSWIAIDSYGVIYYANGLGMIKNLSTMFTDAESLEAILDIPAFAFYIIAGVFILFLISGVLQILGVKSRTLIIIGTIVVLCITTLIFLGSADVLNREDWVVNILGTDEQLVEDFIPWKIFNVGALDIGMYLLWLGGIIGIAAAVYGPSEL